MESDPATKADLAEAKKELKSDIEQLRSEMNHIHHDLAERMHDTETRLLKAFYNFVESNQKRMVELEVNEVAIRSRKHRITAHRNRKTAQHPPTA